MIDLKDLAFFTLTEGILDDIEDQMTIGDNTMNDMQLTTWSEATKNTSKPYWRKTKKGYVIKGNFKINDIEDTYTGPLIKQVIGNILLFVPLGYFVSHYCKLRSVIGITIVSLLSSATIEITQHFIGRSVDIDDVILNVLGGIVGYLLYKITKNIEEKLPRIFRKKWFYNLISILLMILICVYLVNTLGGI